MNSAYTTKTIKLLRQVFAVFSLLEQIMPNYGPQFVSDRFFRFMRNNGIEHIRSVPYHPVTNGAIERSIQTF